MGFNLGFKGLIDYFNGLF